MKYKSDYDVIVAGGGFSGVAAAVRAAREGMDVLLIEESGSLGGAASTSLVYPFMGYCTVITDKNGERRTVRLCDGLFGEILDRIASYNETRNQYEFNTEHLKYIFDRLCIESGVNLLFRAKISGCDYSEGRITSVECVSEGGKMNFTGKVYIDATGDADLCAFAGLDFVLGREEDSLTQPMTLCFRLAGVDKETAKANKAEMNRLYREAQSEGKIKNPREDILMFDYPIDGIMHMNTTRIIKRNPTDPFDITKAEIEAREQVFELVDFLRNNCHGFEKCRLLSTAPITGTRESRMVKGNYRLTGRELRDCPKFDDAICCGNYDIDIHNPEGGGTSHYYFKSGEFYTVPYRCLVPYGTENILVAGRCISVDHEAQASIRIMPIVCCIGEAAGAAASVIVKNNAVSASADIKEIQNILIRGGAFLGL